MKLILSLLIILSALVGYAQSSVSFNLKLSGDLYYARTPGSNRSIRLTLQDKLPSVWLVASDNTNNRRLLAGQSFLNGQGQRANLVVFSLLYNYTVEGSSKTFFFGLNGAENDLDQGVVRVFNNNASPTSGKSLNRQPVIIGVSESDFFTVPASGAPSGDINGKLFLKVEASSDKTATIEIDREAQRGNILVAIISQKTGNLLATLNPKDPENQSSKLSFTIDETVLVIPVIRPTTTSSNGIDSVVFQVGDPREVATVTVSEE
jgi:hypothetical protein